MPCASCCLRIHSTTRTCQQYCAAARHSTSDFSSHSSSHWLHASGLAQHLARPITASASCIDSSRSRSGPASACASKWLSCRWAQRLCFSMSAVTVTTTELPAPVETMMTERSERPRGPRGRCCCVPAAVTRACASTERSSSLRPFEYTKSTLLNWYLVSPPSLLRIYTKRAVRSKAVYTSTQLPFELKRYFFVGTSVSGTPRPYPEYSPVSKN